jgi:transposase-like protein
LNEAKVMAALRRVIKLSIGKADLAELESIARSRTEPACRVEGARVLLAYRQDPSFYAVGQALGMHHQKVQRYIERMREWREEVPSEYERHKPPDPWR